jgi:cold shock CspA family protein
LEAFATAIEDIFVLHDFISNRIGSLANYNIRKTLSLARRVITSSALNIEDLLKSYVAGIQQPISAKRFMRTLILGDYNFYKRGDAHFLFPIFDVSHEVAQSPLICVRILALLRAVHDNRSSDDSRYLSVTSILQYFDGMGCSDIAVDAALAALVNASLVEQHDPSIGSLASAQRVAISYSGITHLELALFNPIYFEQMALTALIANSEIAATLRASYNTSENFNRRLRKVRETFARFLIEEDQRFGRVPESEQYLVQKAILEDVRKFAGGASDTEISQLDAATGSTQSGVIMADASAVVDWYDDAKGYGFVTVEDFVGGAFLHFSVLENAGIETVHDGDFLIVELSRSQKGVAVSKVHLAESSDDKSANMVDASVVKVFAERGYGFVFVPTLGQDAFFHVSLLPEADRALVHQGMRLQVEIAPDPKGRGLQVRRISKLES